jgi:hypothetical protein
MGKQRVSKEALYREGATFELHIFSKLSYHSLYSSFFWTMQNYNLLLQEVTFRVDYTAPNIGREFGTVYLGDKNVAYSVISAGWARVGTILFSYLSLFVIFIVLPPSFLFVTV